MIDYKSLDNLQDLFVRLCDERKDDTIPAFKYIKEDKVITVSFSDFTKDLTSAASYYAKKNISGKAGLIGANRYEWLVNLYALWILGIPTVLLGNNFSTDEIIDCTKDTELSAMIYDESCRDLVSVLKDEETYPMWEKKEGMDTDLSLSDFQNGKKPDDICLIFFTSGTSAKKKAVMHSVRSVMAGVLNSIVKCNFESQLLLLPFHHLAGFNPALNTLCLGGCACINDDFRNLFKNLALLKPQYLVAVPSMLKVLVKKVKKGGLYGQDLGWDLRYVNCGGARFTPEIVDPLHAAGMQVMNSYGASETGGLGFCYSVEEYKENIIGRCPKEMEAKIADDELVIKSDSVMMGYYGNEEATAKALKDGWYHTGDLARKDEDGYFYVIGRKSNRIILSNGENVSPEEVEAALSKCELVTEVLVSEKNDFIGATFYVEKLSEEKKALIEAFVADYNKTVVSFKRIAFVSYKDQPFEKNATGKIIRNTILY